MNDYISREAGFEILQSRLDSISQMSYLNMDWHELDIMRNAIEDAINDIGKVPAADVQPIKHGRWVVDEYGYLRCDNCGEVCLRNDIGIYVKSWYCPECGADMRLRGDKD